MTEYEKGYRDAQVKIIQNMYDLKGDGLNWEIKRLVKEIGLPVDDIQTIIQEYRSLCIKKEFDEIVAESDSKEEAVYHLIVSDFLRDYIKEHLGVTDVFINHCLADDIRFDVAPRIYKKLKNKANRSSGENSFYWNFLEGYIDSLKIGNGSLIRVVSMLYGVGKTTETIKEILEPLDLSKDEFEYLIQKAKSYKDNENAKEPE